MEAESDDGRLEALEALLRGTVPTFQLEVPAIEEEKPEIEEEPIGEPKAARHLRRS